jgi:hypothetical protein
VRVTPDLGWSNLAWGWDDGGKDSNSGMKMVDIDLDDGKSAIQKLVNDGHIVICYFSVGTVEPWRPDCDAPDGGECRVNRDKWERVIAGSMSDWDEQWLDISMLPELQDLMGPRFEKAKDYGCHGVEPDNIDCYDDPDCDVSSKSTSMQEEFNRWQVRKAHSLGLAIGMKNAEELIDSMVDDYDFAVNENCNTWEECDGYSKFVSAGKGVFAVQYGSTKHCSDLCGCWEQYGIQGKYCSGNDDLCTSGSWHNCFDGESPLPETQCTSGFFSGGQCVSQLTV